MRELSLYTRSEWLRLRPLLHAAKQWRDDIVLRAYRTRCPTNRQAFLRKIEPLRGQNVALVIAFEQPWVLDVLLRMTSRYLGDATVLVFDNSRRTDARVQLERVCQERNILYLGLPWNPTRHANRSHGMAMTWVYHRIVQALEPRRFGFIDHDLIPMEPVRMADLLGDQPFFGRPNVSQWNWSLWAGFCFYSYAAVRNLPLNFLHDFSRGLDTGGRNWPILYRQHNRQNLRLADSWKIELPDAATGKTRQIRIVDGRWIHFGRVGYGDHFRSKSSLLSDIAGALEAGANLERLPAMLGKAPV